MTEQKDKCPGYEGEKCWYDKELKRYVIIGWDSVVTCPICHGTGEKKLDYIRLNPKTPLEQVRHRLSEQKDRPGREKEIEGLIDKYLKWLRGDEELFTMRMLLEEIIALFPDYKTYISKLIFDHQEAISNLRSPY